MVSGDGFDGFMLVSVIGIVVALGIATVLANHFKKTNQMKYERMKWFGIGLAFGVALMVIARAL